MRGIVSIAGYVPYRRLERATVAQLFGSGGGKGTRAVASHDEDTTTMGVEASRLALGAVDGADPSRIWFSTATPAYLDKTNATALHAALGLDASVGAFDFGGALRSGVGALVAALEGTGSTLVVTADLRDGLPTSPDESFGGDAAAAIAVGEDRTDAPVIAAYLGSASASDEFLDRWRTPGERRSRVWEERFGETRYVPLGTEAFDSALKASGVTVGDVRPGRGRRHAHPRGEVGRPRARRRRGGPRGRPLLDGGPGGCRTSRTPPRLHAREGRARPGGGGGLPRRRCGRPRLPCDRRDQRLGAAGPGRRPDRPWCAGRLRHVPRVARHGHARATAAARAATGVGDGGLAQ